LPHHTNYFAFTRILINSWIFRELLAISNKYGKFTIADIERIIASIKKRSGTTYQYSGTTVPRRRQTIVSWLYWLAKEFNYLDIEDDTF